MLVACHDITQIPKHILLGTEPYGSLVHVILEGWMPPRHVDEFPPDNNNPPIIPLPMMMWWMRNPRSIVTFICSHFLRHWWIRRWIVRAIWTVSLWSTKPPCQRAKCRIEFVFCWVQAYREELHLWEQMLHYSIALMHMFIKRSMLCNLKICFCTNLIFQRNW